MRQKWIINILIPSLLEDDKNDFDWKTYIVPYTKTVWISILIIWVTSSAIIWITEYFIRVIGKKTPGFYIISNDMIFGYSNISFSGLVSVRVDQGSKMISQDHTLISLIFIIYFKYLYIFSITRLNLLIFSIRYGFP